MTGGDLISVDTSQAAQHGATVPVTRAGGVRVRLGVALIDDGMIMTQITPGSKAHYTVETQSHWHEPASVCEREGDSEGEAAH